jgi:hypothetical protein
VVIVSENSQSEAIQSEDATSKSSFDPNYRLDVMPQSSRYVINGFLGMILAFAGIFILFTSWSSMGFWSVVFGLLLIIGAVRVVSFSFTLK